MASHLTKVKVEVEIEHNGKKFDVSQIECKRAKVVSAKVISQELEVIPTAERKFESIVVSQAAKLLKAEFVKNFNFYVKPIVSVKGWTPSSGYSNFAAYCKCNTDDLNGSYDTEIDVIVYGDMKCKVKISINYDKNTKDDRRYCYTSNAYVKTKNLCETLYEHPFSETDDVINTVRQHLEKTNLGQITAQSVTFPSIFKI